MFVYKVVGFDPNFPAVTSLVKGIGLTEIISNSPLINVGTFGIAIDTSTRRYAPSSLVFAPGCSVQAGSVPYTDGDFTVEWVTRSMPGGVCSLVVKDDQGNERISLVKVGSAWIGTFGGTSLVGTGTAVDGVWQHSAIVSAGGIMRLLVDGHQYASASIAGEIGGTLILSGDSIWVDEVRLTSVARYGSVYKIPGPFPLG